MAVSMIFMILSARNMYEGMFTPEIFGYSAAATSAFSLELGFAMKHIMSGEFIVQNVAFFSLLASLFLLQVFHMKLKKSNDWRYVPQDATNP